MNANEANATPVAACPRCTTGDLYRRPDGSIPDVCEECETKGTAGAA
jgi:uncharacterized protein (DUF983 family)